MIEKYIPSGHYEISSEFQFTDKQRSVLLDIVSGSKHPRRNEFLSEIELAINAFHASKSFHSRAKKSEVKARLEDVRKLASQLAKRVDSLDEHSHWLLSKAGRGPNWPKPIIEKEQDGSVTVGASSELVSGFTITEARHAVSSIKYLASTVLAEINSFSDYKPSDYPRRNLVIKVATAFTNTLGLDIRNEKDQVFSQCLREVMDLSGILPRAGVEIEESDYKKIHVANRDVRKLIKNAISELKEK